MLTNMLEYKGYFAKVELDPSSEVFHGRVIGMRDVIDFYGATVPELREEFAQAVDDYLAWCAEDGVKPEKTWQGKTTFRPRSDDLRYRMLIAATAKGLSVNEWLNDLVERETRELTNEVA